MRTSGMHGRERSTGPRRATEPRTDADPTARAGIASAGIDPATTDPIDTPGTGIATTTTGRFDGSRNAARVGVRRTSARPGRIFRNGRPPMLSTSRFGATFGA